MGKDVSIVFKARDRLSTEVKQMRSGVQGLQADIKAYGKTKDKILEEKTQVKLDTLKARENLKALTKEVKKGAEGAEEAWKAQQKELDILNEKYRDLTKQQKEAAKAEKDLHSTRQKASNADGGLTEGLRKFSEAGLGKMAGGVISAALGYEISSTFGSGIGDAIGTIGGSIASGAAMGSIIPGIGTVAGAAIGGITGAIQSFTQYASEKDSYYQQEVESLYQDSLTELENRLESGSAIAATRETYQRGFQSTLGKEAGNALFAEVKQYGDMTAYDTTTMLGKAQEMLAYGIDGGDIMELMEILGDIAGGNTTNFSGLSYAISQSMAAGKLNAQDKNQMVNYGLNPLEFVAKNQGISIAEATDMMSAGQIDSDMLLDALRLAVSEGERFHDGINALSDTYDAMTGQLESAWSDLEAAAGDSYNEKRKEGIAAELNAMEEMNDSLQNAYEMVGAYEAELENQHQQSILNAMEDAARRIEEEGLEGIEAERVMWEAKTQAEIDYKNSEEYQMKLAAEKDLVANIQSSLAASGEYVQFGYEMAQQFSKGWQSGRLANAKSDINSKIAEAKSEISSNGVLSFIDGVFAKSYKGTPGGINGYATGLSRVPYDGFWAKLHEGEQVLTRQEAKERGGSITIAKLADQIVVREEADIDRIAGQLAQKIMEASESFVGA